MVCFYSYFFSTFFISKLHHEDKILKPVQWNCFSLYLSFNSENKSQHNLLLLSCLKNLDCLESSF